MKYLMISPGLCVLPTMEKPELHEYVRNIHGDEAYRDDMREYEQHLESLPKLPTTCTLPAGEWFVGRESNQVFSPDTSNWTEEDWEEAQAEARRELPPTPRKLIVREEIELKYCDMCNQMTNHKGNECGKCGAVLIGHIVDDFENKKETFVPVEQKSLSFIVGKLYQPFGHFIMYKKLPHGKTEYVFSDCGQLDTYNREQVESLARKAEQGIEDEAPKSEPVEQEGCVDFQEQIKRHIREYKMFDWHEALTENEMTYLVDLMLTFSPDRWWESPKQSDAVEFAKWLVKNAYGCEYVGTPEELYKLFTLK